MPRIIISIFFIFLFNISSFAQTNKSTHYEIGVITGPWLPSNFIKLSEIVPLTGIRFSPAFGAFRHELTYLGGRASGIEITKLTWAIRNDIGVTTSLDLFWLAGVHYMRYIPKFQGYDEVLPLETASGWYFGFGTQGGGKKAMARIEFSLGMRPGRHLYVGLGFVFILGDGDDNSAATAGGASTQ
jgi:hypothetical protein